MKKNIIAISSIIVIAIVSVSIFIYNNLSDDKVVKNSITNTKNVKEGSMKKMVVLGDSISSFGVTEDVCYEGGQYKTLAVPRDFNNPSVLDYCSNFYRASDQPGGISSPDQMWWGKYAKENNLSVYVSAFQYSTVDDISTDMAADFRINQIIKLNPDLIFIMYGINNYNTYIGGGANANNFTKNIFKSNYEKIIEKLVNNTSAKIVMLKPFYNPEISIDTGSFNDYFYVLHEIATSKYQSRIIYADLTQVSFDTGTGKPSSLHPNAKEMSQIADFISNFNTPKIIDSIVDMDIGTPPLPDDGDVDIGTPPVMTDVTWKIDSKPTLSTDSTAKVGNDVNISITYNRSYASSKETIVSVDLSDYISILNNSIIKVNDIDIGKNKYKIENNLLTISLGDYDQESLKIKIKGFLNKRILEKSSISLVAKTSISATNQSPTFDDYNPVETNIVNVNVAKLNAEIITSIDNTSSKSIGDKTDVTININNKSDSQLNLYASELKVNLTNIELSDTDLSGITVNGSSDYEVKHTYSDSTKISNLTFKLKNKSINVNSGLEVKIPTRISKNINNSFNNDEVKITINVLLPYNPYDRENTIIQELTQTGYMDTLTNTSSDSNKSIKVNTSKITVLYKDVDGNDLKESKEYVFVSNSSAIIKALNIPLYSPDRSEIKFDNILENETVKFTYTKDKGKSIIQKYLDENNNIIKESDSFCNDQELESTCTVSCPEIDHYKLLSPGENTYTINEEIQSVQCSYKKLSRVVVVYKDEDGNEIEITNIDGNSSDEYKIGDKNIEKYQLVTSPDNSSGTFKDEDIIVTYVYKKIESDITIKYVDENGIEIAPSEVKRFGIGDKIDINAIKISGYKVASGIDSYKLLVSKNDGEYIISYKKLDNNDNPKTGNYISLIILLFLSILSYVLLKNRKKALYRI